MGTGNVHIKDLAQCDPRCHDHMCKEISEQILNKSFKKMSH